MAAPLALALLHPVDPATTGASVDRVLAVLPVGLAATADGYALDVWLRNDHDQPIAVPLTTTLCLRGSAGVPVTLAPPAPPNRDGELWLPLVPGEASRLRLECRHGPGASGPFGLDIPEIVATPTVGPERRLLTDIAWRLHEDVLDPAFPAGLGPVNLSYRRPARSVPAAPVPSATRVALPLRSPRAMEELGLADADRYLRSSSGRWRRGRWITGPEPALWRVDRHEAARLWAEGSPNGWAVEAEIRVRRADAAGRTEGCVGMTIGQGHHAYDLSFEPGLVRLGRHTAPAVTDRWASWRVEAGPREVVVTRDGEEVLRVWRLTDWDPGLVFGHLRPCALESEWRSVAFEVDRGAPRWDAPWPETWEGYGVGAARPGGDAR